MLEQIISTGGILKTGRNFKCTFLFHRTEEKLCTPIEEVPWLKFLDTTDITSGEDKIYFKKYKNIIFFLTLKDQFTVVQWKVSYPELALTLGSNWMLLAAFYYNPDIQQLILIT